MLDCHSWHRTALNRSVIRSSRFKIALFVRRLFDLSISFILLLSMRTWVRWTTVWNLLAPGCRVASFIETTGQLSLHRSSGSRTVNRNNVNCVQPLSGLPSSHPYLSTQRNRQVHSRWSRARAQEFDVELCHNSTTNPQIFLPLVQHPPVLAGNALVRLSALQG